MTRILLSHMLLENQADNWEPLTIIDSPRNFSCEAACAIDRHSTS
jgi:hypothetical protein